MRRDLSLASCRVAVSRNVSEWVMACSFEGACIWSGLSSQLAMGAHAGSPITDEKRSEQVSRKAVNDLGFVLESCHERRDTAWWKAGKSQVSWLSNRLS